MRVVSLNIPSENNTTTVNISGTSAQSVKMTGSDVVLTVSADCFVVRGKNPTATTAGLPLLAAAGQYRVTGMAADEILAFITTGATGTVKITQNA